MMGNGRHLGVRAYARHRGVSAGYVSRLVQAGTLPRDEAGRIDVAAADAALDALRAVAAPGRLAANARQRRNGKAPAAAGDDAGGSWADERRRLATAQADLAELERDRLRGLLIERHRAELAIADVAGIVRASFEQIPDRIASRLAGALGVDLRPCRKILDDEIAAALKQAATMIEALPDRLGARRQ